MAATLQTLFPVFAMILLGFAAARSRLIEPAGLRGLNDFTFWLPLPALLFGALTSAGPLDLPGLAGVYLIAALLVFFAALAFSLAVQGGGVAQAAVFALNATYGNVVFLATPVVAMAYGDAGLAPLLGIVALHSGVLLPLAAVLVEVGSADGAGLARSLRRSLRGIVGNPVVMSILAAFLWRAGGLAVPDALRAVLRLLSPAAAPLALFCVGASLPGWAGVAALREAAYATICKMLVLPGVVLAAMLAAGQSGLPLKVALVTAAMPTGANAFLLARRARVFAGPAAATVLLATILATLMIPTVLLLLR
jgi:predicted permease